MVLAVVALVAIVAIASSGSAPSGGVNGRRPSEGILDTAFSLLVVLMAVGAVLTVGLLAFFGRYTPEEGGAKRRGPLRSIVRVMLVLGFVALIVWWRARDGRPVRLFAPWRGENGGAGRTGGDVGYEPEFAVWPVVAVSALVLIALGAWWLSARGRRSTREPTAATPREALADVLAATLDDLRAEGDPRRAVIGAYARMERSLASVGLSRGATEAPEEYLERILAEVSVSGRAAGRLTALFAWARFSVHDVRPEMKDEAIDTLEQMQRELAAAETEREARLAGVLA